MISVGFAADVPCRFGSEMAPGPKFCTADHFFDNVNTLLPAAASSPYADVFCSDNPKTDVAPKVESSFTKITQCEPQVAAVRETNLQVILEFKQV